MIKVAGLNIAEVLVRHLVDVVIWETERILPLVVVWEYSVSQSTHKNAISKVCLPNMAHWKMYR